MTIFVHKQTKEVGTLKEFLRKYGDTAVLELERADTNTTMKYWLLASVFKRRSYD